MASVGRPPKGKATPGIANAVTDPKERDNNAPVDNTVTQSKAREDGPIDNANTSPKVP